MSKMPDSINYLPLRLRDKPLYVKIATMLDYLRQEHYEKIIAEPSGKWDPDSEHYKAGSIVSELHGHSYLKYLQDEESLSTLSRLLNGIYRMKGTKRAINLMISLLGVEGQVTTYFDVQRQMRLDTDKSRIWANGPEAELKPCEILVVIEANFEREFQVTQERLLRELVDVFLWSCARLASLLIIRYVHDYQLEDLEGKYDSTHIEKVASSYFEGIDLRYGDEGLSYNSQGLEYGQPEEEVILNYGDEGLTYNTEGLAYGRPGAKSTITGIPNLLDISVEVESGSV